MHFGEVPVSAVQRGVEAAYLARIAFQIKGFLALRRLLRAEEVVCNAFRNHKIMIATGKKVFAVQRGKRAGGRDSLIGQHAGNMNVMPETFKISPGLQAVVRSEMPDSRGNGRSGVFGFLNRSAFESPVFEKFMEIFFHSVVSRIQNEPEKSSPPSHSPALINYKF